MSLFSLLVSPIVCPLILLTYLKTYMVCGSCAYKEKSRTMMRDGTFLILFWCLQDIVPSVKQCASKRNSSRVNSAYVDIIEGIPSFSVD